MSELQQQLLLLAEQCRLKAEQQGDHWRAFADPAEVSPAQYGEPSEEQVGWWPVAQHDPLDFSGLEQGLGLTLHSSVKEFYATLWGADLQVSHPRGPAGLLLLWHPGDFIRLQQNLIAHVLMKRRLKQRETVFFAVTDEEDSMLSVLNSTGEVYLEQTGQEVKQLLAPDLLSFLRQLSPA
ncbi:MAG: SecY-interacting protein [Rheinheimera sp.]|nr:SecY-interacting protein [Rheinheimera sp.]